MQIDLELKRGWKIYASSVGLVVLLVALGFIGYRVTPVDHQLLTWQEWQIHKSQQQYRRELAVLQAQAELLAELISQPRPDVVRTLALLDQVEQSINSSQHDALATQREVLLRAVLSIRNWIESVVTDDTDVYQKALQDVKEAVLLLNNNATPTDGFTGENP